MKRREFLRKLTKVGIKGCIAGFCLKGLFKTNKVFGKTSMKLEGGIVKNPWHHFVYQRVGNVEEVYIDGEVDEIMALSDFSDCDIKNYRRDICGNNNGILIEEEFWFRWKV